MDFPYDKIKYRTIDGIDGLILAIAQDADTNEVLMAAYTNKEGIEKSLETGRVHYYSTSRKKLWLKGETSGHFQKIKEMYVDCDIDAILYKIEQTGAACHEGYRSCFFRRYKNKKLETCGKKVSEKN
ncbi:MAG: phosphoribosyl-AMP cyclohydrolase [Candidatus Altiarchaeia archaeon]